MKSVERLHRLLTDLIWKQEKGRLKGVSTIPQLAEKVKGDTYSVHAALRYLLVLSKLGERLVEYGKPEAWDFEYCKPFYDRLRKFYDIPGNAELVETAAKIAYFYSARLERFLRLLIVMEKNGSLKGIYDLYGVADVLARGTYPPYSYETAHSYLYLLARFGKTKNWNFRWPTPERYQALKTFYEASKRNQELVEGGARIAYSASTRLKWLLRLFISEFKKGSLNNMRHLFDIAGYLTKETGLPYAKKGCYPYLMVLTRYGELGNWKFSYASSSTYDALKQLDKEDHKLVVQASGIAHFFSKRLERFLNLLISSHEAGLFKGLRFQQEIAERMSTSIFPSYTNGTCTNYLQILTKYSRIGKWEPRWSNMDVYDSLKDFASLSKENALLVTKAAQIAKQYNLPGVKP